MKKLVCLIILATSLVSTCIADNNKKTTDILAVVTIVNKKILPILDSILIHETTCDYYNSNLKFSIFLDSQNNNVVIGSIGPRVFKRSNILGCLEYKNHLFIIKGLKLDKSLFQKSRQKKPFIFAKSQTHYNKKNKVFVIDSDGIQDDSFSYWYYEYKNNEFIYLTHNCCNN